MLTVPPALMEALRLNAGDKIDVSAENGRLVAAPERRRRYKLRELLAQCKPGARRSRQDREWLQGGRVGGELI